ncbi:TatD family hydrolase [Aminiphilus circumscriptus]|uniref:TatD family hydrolase n=1 Tax=Aminiphilus circumscriptus TaxID=290732 RepID=UPI0004926D15|nr:TatD family hydrolase [Aminiphilus circumscriptus]
MHKDSLADTHCHLDMEQFGEDLETVLDRAAEAGLRRLLVVGADETSSFVAHRLALDYAARGVFAAVGVHPHDASTAAEGLSAELRDLANAPCVAAIGETGLDYHYDHSPRDVQRRVFADHVAWAVEAEKPLVVHIREAYGDALALLRTEGASRCGGVIHCFSGTWEDAKAALDLGFYVSFAGPVTFPRSTELREISGRIPADRILCETDAPYLAPQPFRGRRNEPAYVRFVYETIADVRKTTFEALAEQIWKNAETLFRWKGGIS